VQSPAIARLAGLACLAVALVLAGCGRTRVTARAPECLAGEDEAALIAVRLTNGATGLGRAQAVRIDPPVGQYVSLVAAEIEGPQPPPVGVWALGSWLDGARVMAIDAAARQWSDWGAAVTDASAAGHQRAALARRPEIALARRCMGYDGSTLPPGGSR
jgi:hypothetical protein